MLKTDYIINESQHLSDIMDQIGTNTILSKKLPGIGVTSMEINSSRHSLLVEPNVPVIQGKSKKHKSLFGVYEGVTIKNIKDYFQGSHGYDKIMVTPESFYKVMAACNQLGINPYTHFFCLFDEAHLMVKDVDYRGDMVLPLDDFFRFKGKALTTATPIELSDPRFNEFDFKTVNIHPNYDFRQPVTLISTNNTYQSIKKYVDEHSGQICFFINLTEYTISLIRQLGIEDESAAFCSPKSQIKLKHEYGFKCAYDTWTAERMKRYNFFTGRFFNAFDLDEEIKPDVVMLTDLHQSTYTILDVNTDCVQIAGRFRNGLSSLTHIYTTDKELPIATKDQVVAQLRERENVFTFISTYYMSASSEGERNAFGEAKRSLPFYKMLNADESKNYFVMDNWINDALIKASYHDPEHIIDLYYKSEMFRPTCTGYEYPYEDFEHFKLQHSKMTLKKKRQKMVMLLSALGKKLNAGDFGIIAEMREIDPLIVEAYELLGEEEIGQLQYSPRAMKEAIILKKETSNTVVKLIKNSFYINCKYTCTQIETEITRIFNLCNIHPDKKIRGETITCYFDAVPCKIGKKRNRGYSLLDFKI
ncbi:MAG: hypothetical protein GX416_10505 [Bacteroidales bacterium]|nr:hypothetical protein [Bacteroidales bacterium]